MERRTFLKSTGASVIGGALGAGSAIGAFDPTTASAARQAVLANRAGRSGPGKPLETQSDDLTPYTGAWGETQLRHLLRRCMFGVPESQFLAAQQTGPFNAVATVPMTAVVSQLLACQDTSKVPLPTPFAPWLGTINSSGGPNLLAMEVQEIVNWWFDQMMQENLSIRQKMTLMWTNHFVTGSSSINYISAYTYTYLMTCMANALGNFQTFAGAIAIDPSMLVYLNGNENYVKNGKSFVNENFAREVMELFVLGITFPNTAIPNYTQNDIENSARALTGWTPSVTAPFVGQFTSSRHDTTNKTFLGQTGNYALSDIITILFQQPTAASATLLGLPSGFPEGYTAAYWACQRIYKTFVYYDPYNAPSPSVIDAMARLMIQNNFAIAPVMQALLTSSHFYDPNVIGAQIKSPAEYMGSLVREFGLTYPSFVTTDPPATGKNDANNNPLYTDTNPTISIMTAAIMNVSQGQQLLNPPNVAGWPGGENWLSAGSFQGRQNYSDLILASTAFVNPSKNWDLAFNENTYAGQIPNWTTEAQLTQGLEDVSLSFTLGPIESATLDPDPTKSQDVVDTTIPTFAPALAQLPEFQLF
jgi:uncharacterized protein (DUF1800 family)